MVSDLDIWRAANLLIREHGDDAELEAARLQDLMLDRGNDEGRRVGDRSAAGAGIVQAKLKLPRASVVREAWDRLLDFAIATWFGLLDRLAPLPETAVDQAIREEGERPRKAFPIIDFDNPGARRVRGLAAPGSTSGEDGRADTADNTLSVITQELHMPENSASPAGAASAGRNCVFAFPSRPWLAARDLDG
jgi:hypothetical protein